MPLIDEDELFEGSLEGEQPVEQQPEVKAEEKPPEVPDKYRGKSLEDIIQMHREAEKLIGKQAQEVGEVRKLADELLKQQLSKQEKPTQHEEEPEVDYFADPEKAVKKAIEKHPDVLEAKRVSQEMKVQEARRTLHTKHPDMASIVQGGEFIEWVKASPVRVKLFMDAESKFDMEAADELLSTFKQIKNVKSQQTKDEGAEKRNQTLKAVSVDTGGTGETSQKTYRRADLIRLQLTDPARYEALQPEIMAAYAAGRVK